MATKTAAELAVGDVFCREGRPDAPYRVRAVKAVPIYGFFGNVFDTIQVTVDHHLTGRVTDINLSPDERVELLPATDGGGPVPSTSRLRWSRRRKN